MIKCGADMNQFECTGYGGTQPLGSSPELNRRVEIRLLGEDADDDTVTDTTNRIFFYSCDDNNNNNHNND